MVMVRIHLTVIFNALFPYLTKENGHEEIVDEECLSSMRIVILEEEHSEDENKILTRRVREGTPKQLDTAQNNEECSQTERQNSMD